MSRFLFLLFLVSFLFIADSAPYTLTGELQSWSASDPDFGGNAPLNYGNIFSANLDLLGKPTYALGGGTPSISGASSFYGWWNTPTTKQSTLTPFSIVMNDGGTGTFDFTRSSGFSPISGVSLFSFHVRGELNCGTTCTPGSVTVSSSDDFAMYIDGKVICQVNGAFTTGQATTCPFGTLSALSGGQWSHYVDIFYAKRTANSPGVLSFQLPNAVTTCSIFSRSLLTKNIYPFGAVTVQPFANAIFYGTSSDAQPFLQLVKPSDTSSATAVYTKTPIRYQNGFSTYFKFNMTGTNAEGFAFVIQSQSNQGPSGGTGAGLGYAIQKSLAVEFDNLQSAVLGTGCDDVAPHVEIHTVFGGTNTACKTGGISGLTSFTKNTPPSIGNGTTYEVYIEFQPGNNPSTGTGTIYVWIAPVGGLSGLGTYQASRFSASNWVAKATLSNQQLQNMFANTIVYPGFTASSTSSGTNLFIWDWRVNTVPVGAFNTQVSPAASGQTQVARNFQSSKSFTITLQDACGGVIPIGTDTVNATLVSGSVTGSTVVNDLGTGSYDIWWWHTLAANYNLTVSVYGEPIVMGVAPSYYPSPFNVSIIPDIISAPNCFWTGTNIGANYLASDVRNVNITARDQFNNTVSTPTTGFQIFFQTFPASPIITATSQSGPTYLFQIGTHVAAVRSQIFFRYSGTDIAGSPTPYLNVTAGLPPDATQTALTLIGQGLQGSIAGVQATIAFQVLDTWGNIHDTVTPFTANASFVCAPGYTDSRCPNPVSINVVKGLNGNPSWFQVQWTTPVVGPCYTVSIWIFPAVNNSNLLPGLPNVCVLPNNASITLSTVSGATSYTAGSFGTLSIQAKDAFNNSRTSDNSPLNPFTVQIADATTVCGAAPSTTTKVNGLSCVYSGVGGIYTVSFTPIAAGNQTVTVTLPPQAGSVVSTISVLPGPGFPPNDFIQNVPTVIVAGQSKTIQFTSKDKYNNNRLNDSDTGSFVVSMLPVGSSSGTAKIGANTPMGDGLYSVTLSPFLAANHSVDIKLLGQSVNNSPVYINVIPNLTNLTASVAAGTGLFGGTENTSNTFTVTTYDDYQNLQTQWVDAVSCKICTPDLGGNCANTATPCAVSKVQSTGVVTVTYTAPTYNSSNPAFICQLTLNSNSSGNQIRNFPMFSSLSSQSQYGILYYPGQPNIPTCNPKTTSPYNILNNTITAGALVYYYLYNYGGDQCNTPLNAHSSEPQFNIDFNALVGTTHFSGTVVNDTTKTTGAQAVYNVSVTGTKAGWYKITVRGGGIETKQSAAGIYTQVVPGPIDPPSCLVSPASATVYAGSPTTFTINLKDAYGNDLVNAAGQNLQVVVKNQQAQNVSVLNLNVTYSPTTPVVTITFAPTVAGVGSLSVYGPSSTQAGVQQLIALKTFPLTVLAGPVDPTYTCFWGPYQAGPPAGCPAAPNTPDIAGQSFPVPLYARDKYNNQVNDGTLTFSLQLPAQPVNTLSSVFSGGQGLYQLTLQTNKTVTSGALTANGIYPNSTVSTVASTTLTVNPGPLSSVTSWVVGLNITGHFTAGDWVNWTLYARDVYNNQWYSDASASLQLDVSLSGPEGASKASIAVPVKGYIASSSVNPNAQYNYQYIPTTASTNALPTVDQYDVTFTYNGVPLTGLMGNAPFIVFPAAPDATQTLIPSVPPLINAGDMTNFTIQLRDKYQNNIINGSLAPVDIQFYNGPGTQCINNQMDVNPAALVANFTNRRGYISLDDSQRVTDLGNGQYNLTIWTVVAGSYFGAITVGGQATKICRQIPTVFTVVPLDVNGAHSLISGSALDNPDNNIAGTDLNLYLVMKDKYDNIVNKRDQTILVGAVPNDRPNICPPSGSDGLVWLTDSGAKLVNPAFFTFNDNKNGSWNVDFVVYKAATYHLVVLVNTSTVQNQAIGPGCYNLTVLPWYVYTWDAVIPTTVEESLTTSLIVYGKDQFGNNVTHGAHYWKLIYRRTTIDGLAPYGFARNTPQAEPYEVFYNAEHFGNYTASITLVQDPLYADQNKYPVGTQENDTFIGITAASCDRRTNGAADFRCPDTSFLTLGSCQTSWSGCGGAGSSDPCPGGYNSCHGYCIPSASQCPSDTPSDYPSWATVQCASTGGYRQSAAECPTPHTCPNNGWSKCSDGRSCYLNGFGSSCPAPPTCSGGYTCANGACVSSKYDCPTDVTCSTGTLVCQDGTCVSDPATCPSLFLCAPPNTKRCSDGSCRANVADCPSAVTCPLGYAKCETGHCVQSISNCTAFSTTCGAKQVHCPDGTCRDNLALCPTSITCPASRPVLCPDRSCVASVGLCREPMECSQTLPYLCPSGTCAASQVECPTNPTCPLDTPVLCEDLTCAATLSACNPANVASSKCPPHRPYNCPDGSCANSIDTCPTLGVCTPDVPVRCTTAGCAVAGNVCPLQSQLSTCPGVLCPGGGCAMGISQCPTSVTCPEKYERCADGSCRMNCTTIQRDNSTYCVFPLYECPAHEGGYSCVSDPTECPQSPTCPFDRPIRCVDRSCAASEARCKPAPVLSAAYTTCAANTFIKSPGVCSNINSGTGSSTCPFGWAKCWDETCRRVVEDCPPEPLCTVNHPNPRFVAPYVCADGTCARNLYQCAFLSQCPAGQIRCPVYYETGPDAGVKCVNTLSECANITSPSIALTCPLGFQLCRNGACRSSCSTGQVLCPDHLPYQCSDGKCVQRAANCAKRTNCTGGVQRCWDRTCAVGSEQCTDPGVIDASSSLNVCPLSAPFRCPGGFCALSSALCPDLPRQKTCTTSTNPVQCTDGTCVMSDIQCPLIKPCFSNQIRCADGSCATSSADCTTTVVCASPMVMCPNGLCATSNTTCWNELTGCYGNLTKCDDGVCSSSCSTPPRWDGCPAGQSRCWNGACTNCPAPPPVCNPGDPAGTECEWNAPCAAGSIRCANGPCVTAASATTCQTAWGCPIATPFRGVDGLCYNYPADGSKSNSKVPAASGTVVCSSLRPHVCKDGSCAADPSLCPAVQACSSGQLCQDMTCSSSCSTQVCPPGSPTLCPDGSCRKSARECGQLVSAPECTSPNYQCFDGYCASSSLECVSRQFAFGGKSAQFSNTTNHAAACASNEWLCWNGACVQSSQASTGSNPAQAGVPLACPPLPGCPADFPLRCWDGSCINATTSVCPASSTCASGTSRCEDGTCRASGQCPQYAGCPVNTPYFCAYAINQCVASASACKADPSNPQVCASGCIRDGMARSQQFTVYPDYTTVVDVVVDEDLAPVTQITFPSGALGTSISQWTVNPTTFQVLQNAQARINSVLTPRTPAQILLSPPFYLQWNGVSASGQKKSFNLNVTVTSNIDTALYSGALSSGQVILTNPCQLYGGWTPNVNFNGANCLYALNVTNTTTIFSLSSGDKTKCPTFGFTASVSKVNTSTDQTADVITQQICICSNVTKNTGTGTFAFTVGSSVCVLWYVQGDTASAVFQTDPTKQGICPTLAQTDTLFLSSLLLGDSCSGSGEGLINPNDICLCTLLPNQAKEWQCTFPSYNDRINNPPWVPESGRPNYVVKGKLPWTQLALPTAFCYIPLPQPPAPVNSEESWWQKYGKIVLGVGISMFVLLLILICAISRLIRYRRKYHEERAEAEELREQAQELDEKHGGLGVYDDEVEMIANPLVVEMQELQKQLEQTNAHLKTQEELDEHQMAALDKERQRILEEIKRVKDAIAAQAKNNPTRVDEIPPSGAVAVSVGSGTGTTSSGTGAERQEFNQAPAARRKKQDL